MKIASFWEKVERRGPAECWPWLGGLSRGKPVVSIGKRTTMSARKFLWGLTHKDVPPAGRHVEVTCGNTRCMNPNHHICPTTEDRFWMHVQKTDGCWIWTGALAKGLYGCFGYREGGPSIIVAAHRYSYELHFGKIEGHVPGHPELEVCVCHRCDNPKCVRPDHLFLGSDADNNRDMIAKGRAPWQKAAGA